MIFDHQAELKERIAQLCHRKVNGEVPIFEDSSSYMSIIGGSVLRLAGSDYFILGDTTEGRFGIDDQPKYWVKYAVDLSTGVRKIIKLVFHEQFSTEVGGITIRCRRSPEKESAFLALVEGDPHFMQGVTINDPLGNAVRVIDHIRGASLYNYLADLELTHEVYFHQILPEVMGKLLPCIAGMAGVHRRGQHHGDIRNDHILIDAKSGLYTWIDFDYEVNFSDYDVWSMGNILIYAVGKGSHFFHDVLKRPQDYPHYHGGLNESDGMLLTKHRIANLGKLFPYIPPALNEILLRFSTGASAFYLDLDSQLCDLKRVFNGH